MLSLPSYASFMAINRRERLCLLLKRHGYVESEVLLMTLQNAPPGLDYERDKGFSKQGYIIGINAWNFDLKDLKNEAALIPDVDVVSSVEDPSLSGKPRDKHNDTGSPAEETSPGRHVSSFDHMQDERNDMPDLDDSLVVFPLNPVQVLKRLVWKLYSQKAVPIWKLN